MDEAYRFDSFEIKGWCTTCDGFRMVDFGKLRAAKGGAYSLINKRMRCTLHGLRKAQARRLAEAGATNAEGRAVTGHKTDAMFVHYAQKANRAKLAGNAMAKLRGDLSSLDE